MIEFKSRYDITNLGKVEAFNEYKRLVDSNKFNFVRLVYSSHPYSKGYWIETSKKEMSNFDHIMLEYDNKINYRDMQINEILN